MPPKFIRKKNRLPYPQIYQSNNSFFVTICVQDRKCIFVEETPTFPTSTSTFDINNIIQNEWLNIAKYYSNVVLDEFVIMPNHFHGVISFNKTPIANISQKNTNLSKIISTFKTITTKKIKELVISYNNGNVGCGNNGNVGVSATIDLIKNYGTIWQKSFYDHVVRNEKDLQRVQEYIFNNPLKWELDILNPVNDNKFQLWIKNKKSNSQPKMEG